jgi:hypothetical protein
MVQIEASGLRRGLFGKVRREMTLNSSFPPLFCEVKALVVVM